HFDAVDPFDPGHAIPPWNYKPLRSAMWFRQGLAIQAVTQKDVARERLFHGETAGNILFVIRVPNLLGAGVGAEKHDFNALRPDAAFFENRGQWHARPLRIPDQTARGPVSGAFERYYVLRLGPRL